MTTIKSDLKTLLINNLKDIDNASSPATINNLVLAMQNETNDVFKLQDWDKVRDYCWNLASYKGLDKDKLGFIIAERNNLFEANVLRAISVYKEQKIKGGDSKIQFKEKSFIVKLADYKPDHKDLEKSPNKIVKLPLSELINFSDESISGVKKTKGTVIKPLFNEVVFNAVEGFKTSICKGTQLIKYNKKENTYGFNYETFIDKFDSDVVKDLNSMKDFIELILDVNETAISEATEDGKVKVDKEISDVHIVEFKPFSKMFKVS